MKFKKTNLYIIVALILVTSCGRPQKTEDLKDVIVLKSVNSDSLIMALYQFAGPYFKINSFDSIIALKGKPENVTSIPWGEHVADSLLTFDYNFIKFNFWKSENEKPKLASVYLLDKNVLLPGNFIIGKTRGQDILQNLGQPDVDYEALAMTRTKNGDTTIYGRQTESRDTLTFTYYINIDEYAIDLIMINDTLRNVSWSKNPY